MKKPIRQRRDPSREPSYPVGEETTLLPFLLDNLKGKSRNNVKSLLTRRLVAVDGHPTTRYDAPLRPGQQVTILSSSAPQRQRLPFPILHEDAHLLVINKPAGLLSIATDSEKLRTAYHMVTDYVKARDIDQRVFVLHRLDRDTSGVLMFAKDPETKAAFQERWNEIILKRGYTAVAEGTPQPPQGRLHSYLLETSTHLVYSGDPGPGAQEAITNYAVTASKGPYSLLDISIETGRKNQIRVQLKDLGHPIAGDKQYGAHTNPLGRLCLHAGELSFRHPVTGRVTTFTAPTPREFLKLMG